MNKKLNYRFEMKHKITEADVLALKSRLYPIMKKDENASKDGKYLIRSLYFDTPEDKALLDKLNGVAIREKFRIRFYNNDCSYIRLEKKSNITT
ncbi:VTC domain-containing protein [Clostridioides difficile]|nr:VTC domain-containing protein [Clostridioides difficile]